MSPWIIRSVVHAFNGSRLKVVPLLGVALFVQVAACSDEPELVQVAPGIHFLKGTEVSDTIGAIRSEQLQLSVGDAGGHAVAGMTVVFSSMVLTEPGGVGPVLVGPSKDSTFKTFHYDSTNANGIVNVSVKMGDVAGKGALIVNVPSLQLVDTAEYTILPGNALYVQLLPEDTAMTVGKTLTLRAKVGDRYGNARSGQPAYRVVGSGATVTSAGVVSATQPARVAVIASVPGTKTIEDTTLISVVPAFTIAVRNSNSLATLQLDGSGYQNIPTSFLVVEPSPRWSPDGQHILMSVKTRVNEVVYAQQVSLNGAFEYLLPPPFYIDGVGGPNSYEYSSDGRWIYFSAGSGLYRSSSVGVTPERLCVPGVPPLVCKGSAINYITLSPDATLVAFEENVFSDTGYNIRIFDIPNRAERVLNVIGRRPRWSPVADLIAYWAGNRIWVMNSNGTNQRAITPLNRMYQPGVSWSRDGQWVVSQFQANSGNATLYYALINVATGLELPLAYFGYPNSYALPDFKPVP